MDGSHKIRGMEIFASGTHRSKDYTSKDLAQIVANFRRYASPESPRKLISNPCVIGHEEDQDYLKRTDLPAAGWITNVYVKGDRLFADVDDVPAEVARLLKGKAYKTVSAEIYDDPPDGIPAPKNSKMLRRVAFLGGEIPEVKGLADVPTPERYSERANKDNLVYRGRVKAPGGFWVCFSEVARHAEGDIPSHVMRSATGRHPGRNNKQADNDAVAVIHGRRSGSPAINAIPYRPLSVENAWHPVDQEPDQSEAGEDDTYRHAEKRRWWRRHAERTPRPGQRVSNETGHAVGAAIPDPDHPANEAIGAQGITQIDGGGGPNWTYRNDQIKDDKGKRFGIYNESGSDQDPTVAWWRRKPSKHAELPKRHSRPDPSKPTPDEQAGMDAADDAEQLPSERESRTPRRGDRVIRPSGKESTVHVPGVSGSGRSYVIVPGHDIVDSQVNTDLKDAKNRQPYDHAEDDAPYGRHQDGTPANSGDGLEDQKKYGIDKVRMAHAADAGRAAAEEADAQQGFRYVRPEEMIHNPKITPAAREHDANYRRGYNKRRDEIEGATDHAEPWWRASKYAEGGARLQSNSSVQKNAERPWWRGGAAKFAEGDAPKPEGLILPTTGIGPKAWDKGFKKARRNLGYRSDQQLLDENPVGPAGPALKVAREAGDESRERAEKNSIRYQQASRPQKNNEAEPMREKLLKKMAEHGMPSAMADGMPDDQLSMISGMLDQSRGPMEDDMPEEDEWPMDPKEGDEEGLARLREKGRCYAERAKKFLARYGEAEPEADRDERSRMEEEERKKGMDRKGEYPIDRMTANAPAKMSETALADLHDTRQLRQAAQHKIERIDSLMDELTRAGKLPPSQSSAVRQRLMRADNLTKFSEGGKEVTEFDLQAKELRSIPAMFGERFRQPAPGSGSATEKQENELSKVRKFSETAEMTAGLEAAGRTKEEFIDGFKDLQKVRPDATAVEYGVPDYFTY